VTATSVALTVLTNTTETLTRLATDINEEHEAAHAAAHSALHHARRAGELLLEAKADLPYGTWLPWLAEHCPTVPERTARAYMQIARRWSELEGADRQRVADLPIRQALKLLAEPRTPEPSTAATGINAHLYVAPAAATLRERDVEPTAATARRRAFASPKPIDCNRVITAVVEDLANLLDGVEEMVDFAALDQSRLANWVQGLRQAEQDMARLRERLEREVRR
jgi:hypothetical protein